MDPKDDATQLVWKFCPTYDLLGKWVTTPEGRQYTVKLQAGGTFSVAGGSNWNTLFDAKLECENWYKKTLAEIAAKEATNTVYVAMAPRWDNETQRVFFESVRSGKDGRPYVAYTEAQAQELYKAVQHYAHVYSVLLTDGSTTKFRSGVPLLPYPAIQLSCHEINLIKDAMLERKACEE